MLTDLYYFVDYWGSITLIYVLCYLIPSIYIVKLLQKAKYYAHDNEKPVPKKRRQRQKNRRKQTTARA